MKFKIRLAGLACLVSLTACAPFGTSSSDLEQRVDDQDLRLRQMQPQQAETWNEVQSMREEIAQLKGQIAQMNRNQQAYQPDAPQIQADSGIPPQDVRTYEPVTGITPSATNAPDSSAYRQSQPITQASTGTQLQQPQSGNYGLPPDNHVAVNAPTEATWGKADPTPEPQVQVAQKDISLALFDAGVNAYNARKYQEAEKSFRDFLKNYPNHSQTAEAQYYLAETQFQRNRFPEAALAYDTVIKKYPKSASARAAMLMQGIAFSKMGQTAAAKARMQEVISKYPNTAEATRAKTFLKTNK